MTCTIIGAVIGKFYGTGRLYGLFPGIVIILWIVHFRSDSFFKKDAIQLLRQEWLARRRVENKNNPERMRYIIKAERIVESE
jgi:hypothetical protein